MNSLPAYWFDKTGKTQRRNVTTTNGSVAVSYADFLTGLAMRIVPGGGSEAGGQERLNAQTPNKIYVNGVVDIVPTDRIVCNSRVYDIQNVNDFDESDVYMRMDAVEVLPSGVGA